MVSHQPAKFGTYRHSDSKDIMFLVAKEENSKCYRFNQCALLFISKGHDLKAHGISH